MNWQFPEERSIVVLPETQPPVLSVVVHTEEEFDWAKDFSRDSRGVSHMKRVHHFQRCCDDFRIVPTYVTDYPVAEQPDGFLPLAELAQSNRALIGAHLHPWVTPPYDEALSAENSYPGNLPKALERAKLRRLTELLEDRFESSPTVYLAGRYGLGPNTSELLEELGYEVDLSVCVPIDCSADCGPDYSSMTSHPYWFGPRRRLLGLPCSGDYVGWWPGDRAAVYREVMKPWARRVRLGGVLARTGALERISLSPEGFTLDELQRLTRFMLVRGYRAFVFSLHSPSLAPGFTPYVRDERELADFLMKCRSYFDHFLNELGGVAMTPLQFRAGLDRNRYAITAAKDGDAGGACS